MDKRKILEELNVLKITNPDKYLINPDKYQTSNDVLEIGC